MSPLLIVTCPLHCENKSAPGDFGCHADKTAQIALHVIIE